MASERTRRIRGTRTDSGRLVRQAWLAATDSQCEALDFADLELGEKFISLPGPGDNHGHGGLLCGAWLFIKIEPGITPVGEQPLNAVRLVNGCKINFSDGEQVYSIQ
jgi:hypothetical protein